MRQLIERWGLRQPILDLAARGAPIFGTCAGMIVLAREIAGGEPPILPLLDVTVERNAFGRQLDSFEAELAGRRPRRHDRSMPCSSAPRSSSGPAPTSTSWPGSTTVGSWPCASGTSSPPRSTPSSPGETRFHRLVATMASEHEDPGEGSGRRPHPTRRTHATRRMSAHDRARPPRSPGKVRAARLTDLAALGELSRLCQSDDAGDPLPGAAGQRAADRRVQPVPAAARRVPAERPHVRLRERGPDRRPGPRRARDVARRVDDRRARRGRDGRRRRHPLSTRPASSCARAPSAAPPASTSPAPTPTATSSCSCRPGSCATARSASCIRAAGRAAARAVDRRRAAAAARIRPAAGRSTPSPLHRLYTHGDARAGRPPGGHPPARLGAPGQRTGGCRAPASRRSCASPTSRRSSRRPPTAARTGRSSTRFLQVGVAKEDQPHYLKVMARPDSDVRAAHRLRPGRHRGPDRPRAATIATIAASSPPCEPMSHRSIVDWRRRAFDSIAQRHPAHEGDPRPGRRTGPRAGRRPLSPTTTEVSVGSEDRQRETDRRSRRPAHVAAARDRRRRPRPARIARR